MKKKNDKVEVTIKFELGPTVSGDSYERLKAALERDFARARERFNRGV